MAYYEKGFANVQDNFTASGKTYWNCYTYSATTNPSTPNNKALCILRWYYEHAATPDKHLMTIVGLNINTPFNPSQASTIDDNVSNYIKKVGNSYIKARSETYDNDEGVLICPVPDYENVTLKNKQNIYIPKEDDFEHGFRKTDLPIFTVTNTDFDKLNNYIQNGDDSGADNYEDLHPKTYHTDVWLDGNFPNIWFKTSYSGDLPSTTIPQCDAVINVIPVATPVVMYDSSYEFDGMIYVAYGQYSNPTPLPIVTKTPYGIAFTLDGDFGKKVQATFYIDKSGNVSDIVPQNSTDGTHTIEVHEGTPSESDYSDGSNANAFNTEPTQNKFSGANTLTKTYKLSNDGVALKALGNFLWSSTFKDNVLSLTNYPLENVISIKAMPLIEGGTSEEIKIGNVLTGISGNVVSDADSIETTVGTKQVPRYFNNFIDFSEVDIMIYLPYIGFKKIDNLVAMKRSIRVKYYFDVIMGNCLASIEFKANTGGWLLYDCYQGNCGIDIALTSTNRANIENGYINNALSAVSDIMSLNPVGVAKDVFNGMTQDFHSQSTGVGNPSVMNALDTTCRLIIKRPAAYSPKEYGHTVGYPCYKYMNLSELSGFTQCENFICSLIPYATDGEKAEIKSLLESGIFIF